MEISLSGDFAAPSADSELSDSEVVMSAIKSPKGLRSSTTCKVYELKDGTSHLSNEQQISFEVNQHEDVMVALPLLPEPPPQRVFAFLPVRSIGFRFAIQAPFHLTASRADLHRSPENLRRRNAIAPAFIKAGEKLLMVFVWCL